MGRHWKRCCAIAGVRGLSFDIPLTAKEKIAQLDRYIEKEAPQQMAKLEARLEEIARHIREIQILRDLFALERDRLEAASRLLETREAFWLTAWTPARDVEAVREALCKVTRDVEMEFSDPAEDEEPPVQLRNGSTVAPFESIVGMYSLPAYRGFDPTAVMMPFFLCFFGMMMSDAGYGIIMAITCFFAYSKLKKQNRGGMLWILALGGVATAIWGYLLGGFFSIDGAPQPLGFTFTSDPLKSLILCAILGAVHLFVGLGVAAYMNIRRGKIWAAIFDQGFLDCAVERAGRDVPECARGRVYRHSQRRGHFLHGRARTQKRGQQVGGRFQRAVWRYELCFRCAELRALVRHGAWPRV